MAEVSQDKVLVGECRLKPGVNRSGLEPSPDQPSSAIWTSV
jgi:hypothetical protein